LDSDAVSDEGSAAGGNDEDASTIISSAPSESTTSLASETSSVDPASTLLMKELPWVPKVRQKDLEAFLEHTRKKFVGFSIKDDLTTLIGLPKPIHESIKILKQVKKFNHKTSLLYIFCSIYIYHCRKYRLKLKMKLLNIHFQK
jgi:hypothetical protein